MKDKQDLSSEFVGRETDLQYLIDAWIKTKNGQPQFEVILADSGFGKTRLIQEFYAWLSQNEDPKGLEGYWPDNLGRNGKSLEINPELNEYECKGEIPWLWWGLRWHDTLGRRNATPSSLNNYFDKLLRHVGSILDRREEKQLKTQAILSAAAVLLDFIPGGGLLLSASDAWEQVGLYKKLKEQNARMSGAKLQQEEQDRPVEVCIDLLRTILDEDNTEQSVFPVIIILDDAQWMDVQTKRLLIEILPMAKRNNWPLLIIATHWEKEWQLAFINKDDKQSGRNQEDQSLLPRLTKDWRAEVLADKWVPYSLGKLQTSDLIPIVTKFLPGLTEQQIIQITEKVDGNPLYLDDVIIYLSQNSRLYFNNKDIRESLSERGEAALTKIIHGDHMKLIRDRFDNFSQELRLLLSHASFQGIRFIDELMIDVSISLRDFDSPEVAKTELSLAQLPETVINRTAPLITEFRQRAFYELALEKMKEEDTEKYQTNFIRVVLEWQKKYRFRSMEETDRASLYEAIYNLEGNGHNLDTDQRLEYLKIISDLGLYYGKIANYPKALELANEVLYIRQEILDNGHPDIAESYNDLGAVYMALGQYETAVECYQQALARDIETFGEDHRKITSRRTVLGRAYEAFGQYAVAICYYQQALVSVLNRYGEDHPSVAFQRAILGRGYEALGQYETAIECYQQSLLVTLNRYGEDHPFVASRRSDLGGGYEALGQYEKAIDCYQQALAIDIKKYGEDHPIVTWSLSDLGGGYEASGQHEKAIEYYQQALVSNIKTYGEGHPDVSRAREAIGGAYKSLGHYEKAIKLYQQSLTSDLKAYGEIHPSVAGVRNNLGEAYYSLGQHEKAIEQYQQALHVQQQTLDSSHPDIAKSQDNYAISLREHE